MAVSGQIEDMSLPAGNLSDTANIVESVLPALAARAVFLVLALHDNPSVFVGDILVRFLSHFIFSSLGLRLFASIVFCVVEAVRGSHVVVVERLRGKAELTTIWLRG